MRTGYMYVLSGVILYSVLLNFNFLIYNDKHDLLKNYRNLDWTWTGGQINFELLDVNF